MLVHVPRKVDCPCCANCAIKNTSTDNELDIKNVGNRNFYMDSFLKSLSNVAHLIELSKRVLSYLPWILSKEMDFQFSRNFTLSSD